jgi:hypothetical protein
MAGELARQAGAAVKPSGSSFLTPEQGVRAAAAAAAPADAAKAAAVNNYEQLRASTAGAMNAPAAPAPGAAPAPSGAAPAPSAPAAASMPAGAPPPPAPGTSWALKDLTVGNLGDADVDAALKGAVMSNLNKDPFSPEVVAAEKARIQDEGMAGLGSQKESIEGDLVRRGISRGGTAAAIGGEAESAARASIASNQRSTMTEFAKLSDAHKQQAIGAAQTLATDLANRGLSLKELAMRAAQRGGGGGGYDPNKPIEFTDDEGNVTQVDPRILDLALGMYEGGYE